MTTSLSPVIIKLFSVDRRDDQFVEGPQLLYATRGAIAFGPHEVEVYGDERPGRERPCMKLKVADKGIIRGGVEPKFICVREDGQFVGVIATQHRKQGG